MPTPVAVKHDFRAPADVVAEQIQHLKLASTFVPAAVIPNPLAGTWVNCDHHTRGLVRLMIAVSGKEITVHGFGACSPTPCDWGVVNGLVYAANVTASPAVAFSAVYNFGFKQTIVTGQLFNGSLLVDTFDHFTDNSGRSDYFSQYVLTQ